MSEQPNSAPPILRTLSPLLRGLERKLRNWLDARRIHPVTAIQRAEIEGLADDLQRKTATLDVEHPLLVVMLMGGTGVGKSTLMNALAGATIAQASFERPTTRDPVVYFHQSVNPDHLDPALRLCRLIRHNRETLRYKIIVDTPDVDSNDLENREKLQTLLPVADVVLYVGSQEKYHDQLGWELFKNHHQRRAFAFVLNKWDRCVQVGPSGIRPDEDLLKDLRSEGFENPKLFRTVAQSWIDAFAAGKSRPDDLPEGEDFESLRNWLELGLTRLEIEAVKARGVGQLLSQLEQSVQAVQPPDLTAEAEEVQAGWTVALGEESGVAADVLVAALDPRSTEIEAQFNVRGQHRFRGLMAGYLRLTTMRYSWRTLRPSISFTGPGYERSDDIDLAAFAHGCARTAGERVLDERSRALVNRLLVDANRRGFPLAILNERTADAARKQWDDRYMRAMVDGLNAVEQELTHPTGFQAIVRRGIQLLANYLPEAVLIGSIFVLLWRLLVVEDFTPSLFHIFVPPFATLGVLILLHVVISIVFPLRWPAIRERFHRELQLRLNREYDGVYLPIPKEVASTVLEERQAVAALLAETTEVDRWLKTQESAAQVGDLYGRWTDG